MSNLRSDLQEFKKLPNQKKYLVVIFFLILLIIGLSSGIIVTREKSKPRPLPTKLTHLDNPSPTVEPKTVLSLSPAKKTTRVGEIVPMTVELSRVSVQAVDVVLEFDPRYLAVSNITTGEVFPVLLQESVEEGKVAVSVSRDPDEPKPAIGEVFSFSLTGLSATSSATIEFVPDQIITAKSGKNTLGEAIGASFQIER